MSPRHLDCYGNLSSTLPDFTQAGVSLVCRLIVLLMFLNAAFSCPLNCDCNNRTGSVQCQSLQEIPQDMPSWVQNLTITNSNISVLRASGFWRLGMNLDNLTTLVLTKDCIQIIEAKAFLDLPCLHTLDLSFNAFTSISTEAFSGLSHLRVLKMNQALREPARLQLLNPDWTQHLRGLHTLELSGNELQSVPVSLNDFENLQTLYLKNNSIQRLNEEEISMLREKRMWVYLSPNPIDCDCQIKDMLFWFQNSSQALDAQQLQCYEPQTLNGTMVTKLNGDTLKCTNKDLETASYVFFGIVLALIGVIFLMVLYLNRRGIKRWLNNFREACRDQMEGYHYRYEQDSDPRRSNASTGI